MFFDAKKENNLVVVISGTSFCVLFFLQFIMLTKGTKLKKGSLTVSSQSRRRLSKEAKGKGIARPLDMGAPMGKMRFPSSMDRERALVMDMYSDDFDFERGLASRATKVKAALAQLRDIFYLNYEPWEEVHDPGTIQSWRIRRKLIRLLGILLRLI